MKFLGAFLIAAVLALATPALAQNPQTVKLCIPTSGTACANVTATNPLPVTGSFSATLAGFTPNGNYTTLTATAASSASTALPAGTVVAFQNLSTIDVSCVLTAGASTATTNKLIVRGGSTVYYTVGSNTTAACINQTGVASNVVGLAGGAGLGTAFGGGGSGGGGGAITAASGSYASGALSSGSIAAGAMVDLLTMRGTVAAGTAASNSLLTGCVYNSTPITLTNGQGAAVQCNSNGYPTVVVSNTNANGQATMANSSPVALASNQSANALWGHGVTGAAVPANATYVGFNSGGNLTGPSTSTPLPVNNTGPYPIGAVPYTATNTGTTGATTATLAGASSVTTYICGFSIRANATAAATGNATVTGVITATMNFTQWTAPLASGIGVTEMIFSPCIPASGTNQSVAVVSAAPGSGGTVSVTAWGYKL